MSKLFLALGGALILVGAGCSNGTPRFATPEVSQEEPQAETQLSEDELDQLEALAEQLNQQQEPNRMYDVFPGVLPTEELVGRTAVITTSKGEITFEIFGDTAPKASSNFIQLAEDGYFDELTFHRRVEGFVIQGGDPSGNGTGGPGYRFEDELDDSYKYDRGIVAMANAGPNTNGSQFFIMLANNPLPKAYTIFGRVTSGMEVVDEIVVGDVMTSVEVE